MTRTLEEILLYFPPRRVRHITKTEDGKYQEQVLLINIDGFEKREFIEPGRNELFLAMRPVFKYPKAGNWTPDAVVDTTERTRFFQRCRDEETPDAMAIFREVLL